ncbi:MAG: hypothetical protein HYU37_09290 [Acidobacteria bacterium]|nr:hypothetical protein [Acidobacteriota bacterium]
MPEPLFGYPLMADRPEIEILIAPKLHDHLSTSRMVSDMLGVGALQSRTMTAGGTSDTIATTVHPAKDVVPET